LNLDPDDPSKERKIAEVLDRDFSKSDRTSVVQSKSKSSYEESVKSDSIKRDSFSVDLDDIFIEHISRLNKDKTVIHNLL
jgi:hypothetical protein